MRIQDAKIGQDVRVNKTGSIVATNYDGTITMQNASGLQYTERAQYVEPVSDPLSDPCEGCQKLAEVRADRDNWKATALQFHRNAAYWREELEKLQKEALAEYRPRGDVAKIYVQVSPAVLAQIIAEREE